MFGFNLSKPPPKPPFSTAAKAAATQPPAPTVPAPIPNAGPATANANASPEQPKSNFMMYAVIGFVIFLVLVAVSCYFMFFNKSTSEEGGESETVFAGKSNIVQDETIEINNYRMSSNPDTSSVEITKKGNDKPVWTSDTPGGSEVAWLIGIDGIFRVYHMKYDDYTWRSVKAANVTDTTKLKGPYTYQFKNGVFSVLNVKKEDVWNTSSGEMVVDTSKTIEPTVETDYEVRNTGTGDVYTSVSTEEEE